MKAFKAWIFVCVMSLENSVEIPNWKEIVRIQGEKVVSVDWEKDFRLLELSNSSDERIMSKAYKQRIKLYEFLEQNGIISENISQRGEFYKVYKSSVKKNADYKTGPSLNGNIYYFKNKGIAHDWAESFAKRNEGWTVFIADAMNNCNASANSKRIKKY